MDAGILSIIIRELNRGFNGASHLYQICHEFWTYRIGQTKIDKQSFTIQLFTKYLLFYKWLIKGPIMKRFPQ